MDQKVFIKDLLLRFDAYSKQLSACRETNGNGRDASKIRSEIKRLLDWDGALMKQIESERYVERNLLNETQPSMKKLERQAEKLNHLVAERSSCQARIAELQQLEGSLSRVDDLKDAYKVILANLQEYRTAMPDIYEESERETGVFFFTSPK